MKPIERRRLANFIYHRFAWPVATGYYHCLSATLQLRTLLLLFSSCPSTISFADKEGTRMKPIERIRRTADHGFYLSTLCMANRHRTLPLQL